MGAGKTTKSRKMAQTRHAVLISEDQWLASLYPNAIRSLDDYMTYAGRLKPPIKALVQSILTAGTDVVMDFPANTIAQRAWFRDLVSEIQAPHELIYIDQSDDVCLQQIEKRRSEQPDRAATDTREMFEQVTRHFVPPAAEEGFNITRITGKS
ncbi:ATP-binding protein [Gammaproteobacteria bacterium LSUCC0112]|nr:ATP-binding protein [Gammaproteobacteria bacterium LSUCC0112]